MKLFRAAFIILLIYCGYQFLSDWQYSRYDRETYNCERSSWEVGFILKTVFKLPVYVVYGVSNRTRTYYDGDLKAYIAVHIGHVWINIFGLDINSVNLKPYILTSPYTEYEEWKRVKV